MAVTGGLSLARMREEFTSRIPDLLADWSDATIDEYLNGAHRFAIPAEVPGHLVDGVWTFETTAARSGYQYRPADVGDVQLRQGAPLAAVFAHQLDGIVFVDDFQIRVFRHPERFWYYHRPEDTASSRPYTALIHGEALELRPIPDTAYTVRVPGKFYPDPLTSDGLDYRPRALATACLAAAEAARRYNHPDLAREHEGEAGLYLDQLRSSALGTPRQRVLRRSF